MSRCRRITAWLAVAAVALACPLAASAHAYLVRTVPSASGLVGGSPTSVQLTFDEVVEPRFAIVSVTDAQGSQEVVGKPTRSTTDPRTIVVPIRHVDEGWYLVYWRAISADGHPVRGAFTFAVGPNPGPAPQFAVPSVSESVATPGLVGFRTVVFLAVLLAVGLFVFRVVLLRPLAARLPDVSFRSVDRAIVIATAVGLAATPLYVDVATARFALRSPFDLGAVLPLVHVSAFGRAFLDLEIALALFAVAAGAALWVDRSGRSQRTIAELLATAGALVGAVALLLIPGAAGHAAQTAPRAVALGLDWLHLATAALWLGGLVGLMVLAIGLGIEHRREGLASIVPRFSAVALPSVVVLLASGVWSSVLHLPTLGALWQTSYGQTIIVKAALLLIAVVAAACNLLRVRPRLRSHTVGREVILLRRLEGLETVVVIGAVVGASLLTSLAPPAKALALESKALARVGPGEVAHTVKTGGYTLRFVAAPNRAAVPNAFTVDVSRNGTPVRDAAVKLSFTMLDMEMGEQQYVLTESAAGRYTRTAPALVMVGHWALNFTITPRGGRSFGALIVDRAGG